MDRAEPQRPKRKRGRGSVCEPFPVPIESLTGKTVTSSRWYRYEGKLVANCVWVTRSGDMDMLYKMGFFGKGMLSKSKPGRDEQLRLFQRKRQKLPDDVRRLILTDIRLRNKIRKRRRREWAELADEQSGSVQSEDIHVNINSDTIPSESSVSDDESELIVEKTGKKKECETTGSSCYESSTVLNDHQMNKSKTENTNDSISCCSEEASVHVVDASDLQTPDSSFVYEGSKLDSHHPQISDTKMVPETESFESTNQETSEQTKTKQLGKSISSKSKNEDGSSQYPVTEFLQLSLCEAFFLSYGLGCLTVHNMDNKPLSVTQLWQACLRAQPGFLSSYVAYHHLRSKGWVVRTGEKYGVDFLVYKDGPVFYHSNAAILVQTVDKDTMEPVCDPELPCVPFTWQYLAGLNRINSSVGKDLILFHVLKPSGLTSDELLLPECLSQMAVQELVLRRWIPERSREVHEPLQQNS